MLTEKSEDKGGQEITTVSENKRLPNSHLAPATALVRWLRPVETKCFRYARSILAARNASSTEDTVIMILRYLDKKY